MKCFTWINIKVIKRTVVNIVPSESYNLALTQGAQNKGKTEKWKNIKGGGIKRFFH